MGFSTGNIADYYDLLHFFESEVKEHGFIVVLRHYFLPYNEHGRAMQRRLLSCEYLYPFLTHLTYDTSLSIKLLGLWY